MSKGLSFYYTIIFTGLSTIKAIGSSFHRYQQSPKDALKYFQHFQHRVRVSFFYKTANLRPGALLKMRHFDKGVFFPVNFVKFFRTHFYRTPPVVTFSYHTLKKNKIILSSFSLFRFAMGSYIKDVRTNLGIFGTLSPCPGLSTFGGHLVFFILFTILKYFFSTWDFFHEHSQFTGMQGKGKAISLTSLYYFHPLHRHFRHYLGDYWIRNWTRTGNL